MAHTPQISVGVGKHKMTRTSKPAHERLRMFFALKRTFAARTGRHVHLGLQVTY